MKAFTLALLFVSTSAFAHVEPGTYRGRTADGAECSMEAGKQYFEKNEPHPLNERIPVKVGSDEFVVGHPPVVSAQESLVFFNHDVFQGVLPTRTGAKAIEIEMVHTEQFEGPKSFTLLENFWKTGKREALRCLDIQLVK